MVKILTQKHKENISLGLENAYLEKRRIPSHNKLTEEHKAKIKVNHAKYWLGKKRSENVRLALSKAHKGKPSWNKGIKMSPKWIEKLVISRKGRKLSIEHRKKLSIALSGKNCHWWKGGISKQEYPFEFDLIKPKVKERDNNSCRICRNNEKGLNVHHLDANKNNNNLDNLMALCLRCHSHLHQNSLDNIQTENFIREVKQNG